MQDPLLRYIYQPLVRLTGINPIASAAFAIDAFVAIRLFGMWLEWQASPNAIVTFMNLAFIYLGRTRIWPLVKQRPNAAIPYLVLIHTMLRVTLVISVSWIGFGTGVAWVQGAPFFEMTVRGAGLGAYLLLLSAIYLPLCDIPPRKPRREKRRKVAIA